MQRAIGSDGELRGVPIALLRAMTRGSLNVVPPPVDEIVAGVRET
jgi:hypothetical protein